MMTHVSQRITVIIRAVLQTIESRKVWTWCGRAAWVMTRVFYRIGGLELHLVSGISQSAFLFQFSAFHWLLHLE